jgi:fructose-1,6-bisphosphatase/inositol monophosphatase family enzyme
METDAITSLLQEVAAEVITPRFRALDSEEVWEKGPGDFVTEADAEAERRLTRVLQDAYPDALVLGEEAYAADESLMDAYSAADHAFTIDPVDGTKNFVHGSPDHAVMVAERLGGAVVRAWIWHPQHRHMYVAERGAGAYADGERLTTSPPAGPPSTWRGRTSRRRWLGRTLDGMAPLDLSWVSCGVDYPRLVLGEADYLLYRDTKPWDHAPGSLLVTEAGGVVGRPDGTSYTAAGLGHGTYDAVRQALATTGWAG